MHRNASASVVNSRSDDLRFTQRPRLGLLLYPRGLRLGDAEFQGVWVSGFFHGMAIS